MEVDVPAESSPATEVAPPLTPVETAVVNDDIAAFRAAKQEARTSPAKTAATPAAQPVEQAASTAALTTPAASETAKPEKPRTEARFQELLADRKAATERAERAERELAALRTPAAKPDAQPAVSSPAPAAIVYPPELASIDAYTLKFPNATYEDFIEARVEHKQEARAEQKAAADRQRIESEQRTAERSARLKTWETQASALIDTLDTLKTSDPKAFDAINPELLQQKSSLSLKPGEPMVFGHVLADLVFASEHPVALLTHLSDKAEANRLYALRQERGDEAFYKEIGRIEATFEKAPKASPSHITAAPPPPRTVGSRPSEPADPIASAVASGDMRAFKAAKQADWRAKHNR